jgi:hypothetical protein
MADFLEEVAKKAIANAAPSNDGATGVLQITNLAAERMGCKDFGSTLAGFADSPLRTVLGPHGAGR